MLNFEIQTKIQILNSEIFTSAIANGLCPFALAIADVQNQIFEIESFKLNLKLIIFKGRRGDREITSDMRTVNGIAFYDYKERRVCVWSSWLFETVLNGITPDAK